MLRPQSRSRQRVTREGVRFRAVLRHAEGRALHLFEPAYFRITSNQQLLAGEISRRAKDRHIRAGHARAGQRGDAGEDHIDVTGDERLDQSWAPGNQQNFRRQVVLGENPALLGQPRQRQRNARRDVCDAQLVGCTNRSVRYRDQYCGDNQCPDKRAVHDFPAAIG